MRFDLFSLMLSECQYKMHELFDARVSAKFERLTYHIMSCSLRLLQCEFLNNLFPRVWFDLVRAVENLRRNGVQYVTVNDLDNIAREVGMNGESIRRGHIHEVVLPVFWQVTIFLFSSSLSCAFCEIHLFCVEMLVY